MSDVHLIRRLAAEAAMTDRTERRPAAPDDGPTRDGRDGMAKEASNG